MNGHALARALRQEPVLAGVRLIAISGWGREQDRVQAAEAGFDAHLTKPVDFDVLLAMLADAAGRRGERATPPG
jgi:CheY-like chemotaxis protein